MEFIKSIELLDKAKKIVPVQSQTFSKSWKYFPLGTTPVYLQRGNGSHAWDIDGNEFIDWICGLGPITLGYNYSKVNDAIERQLHDGISFSLPHPLEVELAELLNSIILCADMVRFSKNGTDVTNAAVRLARAYTCRDKIAYFGYHGGGSDWYGITTEKPAGIPAVLRGNAILFEYNNLDSLEAIFEHNQIAAVIMEPMIVVFPHQGFLKKVKELCEQNGALLIFDEIVTGFRMSLGGAQQYFNVVPDLATFGKGMANGMPLSALVGKAHIMKYLPDVFFSYTFAGECLSLAAGIATITEMQDKDTIAHCWEIGKALRAGLKILGLETLGYDSRPYVVMPNDQVWKSKLLEQMFQRGVMLHLGGLINICYSHTIEDVNFTLNAFEDVLKIIDKVELKGKVASAAFKRL